MSADADEMSVLCVDDEPGLAELTATYLERHDEQLTVTTAKSATEALDNLTQAEIDCIVSDYDMPGVDGIEFLEAIRADSPDLPFILYTGRGSEEIASKAVSAGVSDYMQKEGNTDQYVVLARRVRNLVERKRAHDRRISAEQRSRTILETMPDAVLVLVRGEIVYANPGAESLLNAESTAELLGLTPADIVHPDDLADVRAAMTPVQSGEETLVRVSRTMQTLNGQPVPTESTARAITWDGEDGIVVVLRDVTARQQRTRDLQKTTQQLEAILDSVQALIWMRDLDHSFLLMNQEARNVLGIAPDEDVVGKPTAELVSADTARQFKANDRLAMEARNPVTIEEEIQTREGARTYLTRITPLFDDAGDLYATCGVATDITDRKQRERQIESQKSRLEGFTSILSRDLREPLTVARERTELAQSECDSDHIDAVADALERSEVLIEDLLTLAGNGGAVNEVESIDLGRVATDTWASVATAEATVVTETERTIRGDRGRVRRLLEKLFGNAIEHGGDGVTVTVGDLNDGFYVSDDGPGIPADTREQLFAPTCSTRDGNAQLGLQIVRGIVESHGWDITVTESEAGGARFEITGVDSLGE